MEFKVGDVIRLRKRPHGSYLLKEGAIATVTSIWEGYYSIRVTCDFGPYKGMERIINMRRESLWDLLENEE